MNGPRHPPAFLGMKSGQTMAIDGCRPSPLHFHHQNMPVLRQHQIQFSPAATPVLVKQHPPLRLQQHQGLMFRQRPRVLLTRQAILLMFGRSIPRRS